ncbi:hypothetical protein MMPV_006243 [Pyropia vietnamensis]
MAGILAFLRRGRHAEATTPHVLRSACTQLATTTRYAPITVTALGYDRADVAHPLNAFGVLVPSAAPVSPGSSLLGINFTSSTYGDRAPDGSVLLTAYAGGDRGTVTADKVKRDVRTLVGVPPQRLVPHCQSGMSTSPAGHGASRSWAPGAGPSTTP